MYVSYSDESESGDGRGPFVVGGYVAKESEWPGFSTRWASEVLQPYPSIPYVHMVDLRSEEWRQKHSICMEQCREKVKAAIEVITSSSFLLPFVGRINQADYLAARKRVEDKGWEYRQHAQYVDYLCYMTYAVLVIGNLASLSDAQKITFNMDRKRYVSHHIAKNFKEGMIPYLKQRGRHRWAEIVGDFIPLSMEEHMPLQAADVLSWHLRRYWCGLLEGVDMENAQALDTGNIGFLEMDGAMLSDFGSELPEIEA